jgi:hypothetical protein
MKWILCTGCRQWKVVDHRAVYCSHRCRSRAWRRRRGFPTGDRREFCVWCGHPLVYLPQDRLPAKRLHCDSMCARKSRLMARGRNSMSRTRALEVAIGRLQKGRMPSMRAAAAILVDLRNELLTSNESSRAVKISLLKTTLPSAA